MNFLALISAAGIPTTQAELETIWRDTITATGSTINNDNRMSPFWRVFTACITNPVLWLVNLIAFTVMPNAYVKTASGQYLDLLADAVNVTRKPATKATGLIRFTRTDTGTALNIPIDTIIQTAPIAGVIYQLKTTESKDFLTGEATLDVAVEALETGTLYNLAAGYYTFLPVPITGVTAVTNAIDWLTSPGTDIEIDDDLRDRVRNQFGTVGKYHTDSVYRAIITSFAAVNYNEVYFEHDAPRGPGTANAWVLFDFNADATAYLATINNYITAQGYHGHGDDLQAYQLPTQNLTLAVTVWHAQFLTPLQIATLQSDVSDFINAAFRNNQSYNPTVTYPFNRFSFSRLDQELHDAFSDIHSLLFSSGDIVTAKWVPKLIGLTVTMQVTE